jgi:hypothetical protein
MKLYLVEAVIYSITVQISPPPDRLCTNRANRDVTVDALFSSPHCVEEDTPVQRNLYFWTKLTVAHLVKIFPAFWRIQKVIIVLTKARQWTLSYSRRIQSTFLDSLYLTFILILSSHLCKSVVRLSLQISLTEILYVFLIYIKRATCLAQLLLDFIILIIHRGQCMSRSSSLRNFKSSILPSIWSRNILPCSKISRILSLFLFGGVGLNPH